MISLLYLPFIACIFLVFIHVYFGSFVLRRGILFIDLALAQWAALGFIVGHLFHIHQPFALFSMACVFTLIAALILSIFKPIYAKTNLQEAFIGVMYIFSSASAVALISSTGMESSHLNEMLGGHLLFLQSHELLMACSLYIIIGILCLKIHRYFLHSQSRFWDFIFYCLFGLVVTSSVKMVGVLLVFSYLVLPVLTVSMYSKILKTQIYLASVMGIFCSVAGLFLSMFFDIPPSFCIILCLCFVWFLSICAKLFKSI